LIIGKWRASGKEMPDSPMINLRGHRRSHSRWRTPSAAQQRLTYPLDHHLWSTKLLAAEPDDQPTLRGNP